MSEFFEIAKGICEAIDRDLLERYELAKIATAVNGKLIMPDDAVKRTEAPSALDTICITGGNGSCHTIRFDKRKSV